MHRDRQHQLELEVRFAVELSKGTPRAARAQRFAAQILGVLSEYLPRDRIVLRVIERDLVLVAFEHNSEIINVPPEWDHLDRLAIEATMLTTKIARTETLVKPGEA